MKTVGELREFLKDLPNDMLIVQYESGMEKNGFLNDVYPRVRPMKKVRKSTYDRFDGTDYCYDAYEPSENGEKCLTL